MHVAAGQEADRRIGARAADIEGVDQPFGVIARGADAHPAGTLVGAVAIGLQDGVFPHGHVADRAVAMPILRDAADAAGNEGTGIEPGDGVAEQAETAAAGLRQTRQQRRQSALAVAADAGDADDLALEQGQVGRLQVHAAARAGHRDLGEPGNLNTARLRVAAVQLDRPPDHQLCQLAAIDRFGLALAHQLAGAQDRHPVADGRDLVQLVRDEDNRQALLRQPAQRVEQLVHLLRRQHGGRLVQHQDAHTAIERLQDFRPLLLADG